MLVQDPKAVRTLLTRYATLRIAQARRESPSASRELAEVGQALCALTGAATVEDAVAAADALLDAGAAPSGDGELPLAV
ncbi:protein of unknown function [Streptomyces sp. SolWspMP-5a-2]|nr:DUF5133 domain-containing protein [Streptomyces sp. SID4950]SCD84488.1 protein of unknown function [Streptomyces sp. SolWspMP-5a-2]